MLPDFLDLLILIFPTVISKHSEENPLKFYLLIIYTLFIRHFTSTNRWGDSDQILGPLYKVYTNKRLY